MTGPASANPDEVEEIDKVRAAIAATRADLAATVDTLTQRLDVRARAGEKLTQTRQQVAATVRRAKAGAPEPVQKAMDRVGQKAVPVLGAASRRAEPHRKKIAAGAAAALVILLALRNRGNRGEDGSYRAADTVDRTGERA